MNETPTALITGATHGIGAKAAVKLAERGWHVLVHGRDLQRGDAVVARAEDTGGEATFFQADFSSRDAVHQLATDVRESVGQLDALVLNAGIASESCRLVWDGVEEIFAVNQLAPYLLTHELRDMLRRSSPARVVATSSTMHSRGEMNFMTSDEINCSGDSDILELYARSKLANLAFVMELAARFKRDRVTVNAFHPGFVPGTKLYRNVGPLLRAAFTVIRVVPFLGTNVETAAEGIVYLTDSTDVSEITGTYFHGTEQADPDPRVEDPEVREHVWSVSAELTGIDPEWP